MKLYAKCVQDKYVSYKYMGLENIKTFGHHCIIRQQFLLFTFVFSVTLTWFKFHHCILNNCHITFFLNIFITEFSLAIFYICLTDISLPYYYYPILSLIASTVRIYCLKVVLTNLRHLCKSIFLQNLISRTQKLDLFLFLSFQVI